MRREFFSLANANKTQRSSATLGKLHRQIAPLNYLCYTFLVFSSIRE